MPFLADTLGSLAETLSTEELSVYKLLLAAARQQISSKGRGRSDEVAARLWSASAA
jgi:hypothetical protein